MKRKLVNKKQIIYEASPQNLAAAIRARFAPFGGVELEFPLREPARDPPAFD